MRTRFTELVGCSLPCQLAVLGGVGTEALARAVEAAGGLGMVPRRVTLGEPRDGAPRDGALGKGFLIPYLPDVTDVVEDVRGLRVAEFFWGERDANLVDAAHSAGALVSWQIGSATEARAAEAAGCDLVVAQGVEAGVTSAVTSRSTTCSQKYSSRCPYRSWPRAESGVRRAWRS